MNCFDLKPKQNCGFVYRYISPSGKSYIGQTCRSLRERAGGQGSGYKTCTIFYSALQKYGIENFKVEILEEVELVKIDDREKYYIHFYETIVPNGYNVQPGGKDNYYKRKRKTTPIVEYDLQGNFLKNYESVSAAAQEKGCLYQTIESVLSRNYNHYKGSIFRYLDEEPPSPVKDFRTSGRLVGQFSLDGKFIAQFPSANFAARSIGKNSNAGRNIRSVCTGERLSAYGFKWKYLD